MGYHCVYVLRIEYVKEITIKLETNSVEGNIAVATALFLLSSLNVETSEI